MKLELKIKLYFKDNMNVLEVLGLAFVAAVIIYLTSMIWAIKNARLNETQNITEEHGI
jgi:hypothetical protein